MSKPVRDLRFRNKKVGSPAWALLAAVLLAQAHPASTPVLRSFDRVLLLEEKAETSAGVSVGDVNGDGLPDIIVGYVELPGSVYFNTGQGRTFHEVPWNDGKGTMYGLAFADFDGDGWPDIVAARSDAPNGIWFNTRPGGGR